MIAGIFWDYTIHKIKLFYVQAVPEIMGLLLILTQL